MTDSAWPRTSIITPLPGAALLAPTDGSNRAWAEAANALQNGILVEPIRYADELLYVPTGDGLGVTLDRKAVQRFSE